MKTLLLSPGQDIKSAAAAFAVSAQSELLVNCYGLSDVAIVGALIALNLAGKRVVVVVDRTQAGGPADQAQLPKLVAAGIEVVITTSPTGAIDHEKVMVRDRSVVWYGSYNFSASAQSQRNYAVTDDDPAFVVPFLADWQASYDWGKAHPLKALLGDERMVALTAIANDAEEDV